MQRVRAARALPTGPPLALQTTHPRVLFFLGFLTTCIAKRDAMGRKPRRKLFATEGLAMFEKEAAPGLSCESVCLRPNVAHYVSEPFRYKVPPWASAGDLDDIELRLVRIKADLMSEIIAVRIMYTSFACLFLT